MGADAGHLAFVKHDDLLSVADGADTLCHDEDGRILGLFFSALRSAASVLKSSAEKLSSKIYSCGFFTSARAIDRRCFWFARHGRALMGESPKCA